MKKDSTRRSRQPPRLGRIFLDADVDARLEQYLSAVGFDVIFATRTDVDIHDDVAVLKWARRHRRIMVTHDKFRDGPTKYKLYREVYENGGKILQIVRKKNQSPPVLLGKILVHMHEWKTFFENNEGIVLLHTMGMKRMSREHLIRQIQNTFTEPMPIVKRPQHSSRRPQSRKGIPDSQGLLNLLSEEGEQDND